MENDWTCIFSTSNQQKAELLKGLLTHNEINSVVVNKQASPYNMFGEFEVYVNRDDVVKAKFVMKENDASV